MDRTELLERIAETDDTTPYYELLILGPDGASWACNLCGQTIPNNLGCPDDAPRDIPGLARTECDATPPHPTRWVLDGEHAGYGVPCPDCQFLRIAAQLAKANRCRHWPWRRWLVTRRVSRAAYSLGVTTGGGISWGGGEYDHHGCQSFAFRGASRDAWR